MAYHVRGQGDGRIWRGVLEEGDYIPLTTLSPPE